MLNYLSRYFIFLPSRPRPSHDMRLVGERILLRRADMTDWKQWRHLRGISREFLIPWEPAWPNNALSQNFFANLLRRQWRDWRRGTGFAFLVFLKDSAPSGGNTEHTAGTATDLLLGGISLNDIEYGSFPIGTLGYWLGQPYANQGYMTEAVRLVCDFAFETIQLQRLEASCLPHNEASKRVLRKSGFIEEGFAKAYLRINGKWEDHILWGKMAVRKKTRSP